MDALHSRSDAQTNARSLTGSHASVGTRSRPPLGRPWLAAGLAGVGLLISAWFNFVELPLTVTVVDSAQGPVVQSLGIGSDPWVSGVRPMSPVELRGPGLYWVETEDGFGFGLIAHQRGAFHFELLLGTALVLAAAFVGAAKLPGAAALAGGGVAISLAPALPQLGFPAAIPLILLPAATALAAARIPARRMQVRYDWLGVAALAAIIASGLLLMRAPDLISWKAVWTAPLVIGIGLGIVGELFAARSRLRATATSDASRGARLLAAFVPLAATSRLEGADEERSRLAIDLHNRVLPSVRSSARAASQDVSPREATERLRRVETELAGVMQRHETVTLETGGLVGALRVHVASLDTRGVRVAFHVSGDDAGRAPARVELAAYRIGQAAIDNAIRHAGADRIDVSVEAGPERVEMMVLDDGVGLDGVAEINARGRGRMGLAQMRLRAEAVRGSLDIRGRSEEGTEIRFVWSRR